MEKFSFFQLVFLYSERFCYTTSKFIVRCTLIRTKVVVVFRSERLNIPKQFAALFLMLIGTENNDHTITHTFIFKSEMPVNPHQKLLQNIKYMHMYVQMKNRHNIVEIANVNFTLYNNTFCMSYFAFISITLTCVVDVQQSVMLGGAVTYVRP